MKKPRRSGAFGCLSSKDREKCPAKFAPEATREMPAVAGPVKWAVGSNRAANGAKKLLIIDGFEFHNLSGQWIIPCLLRL